MDELRAYLALGLRPGASYSEVKTAYAARAKEIHPEDDPEEFQELHEAYLYLTAKWKKKKAPEGSPSGSVSGALKETERTPEGFSFPSAGDAAETDPVFDETGETPGGFDFERAILQSVERKQAEKEAAEAEIRALLADPFQREETHRFVRFFENTPDEVLKSRYFLTGLTDALRGIPLKKSVAGAIRKNCSEPGRDADPAGMVRERLLARLAESEKGGSWTNSAGWILSWFFLAVGVIVLLEPESKEALMPVWRAAVWAGCILFLILYRFLRRELSRYGSLLLAMAAVLLLSLIAGVIISFVSPGNPFYNRTVDAGAVSAVEALFTAFCALTGAVWRRIRRLTGRKK